MTVPRIYLGCKILIPVPTPTDQPRKYEVREVAEIDYRKQFFFVKGEKFGRGFEQYKPAPTRENFLRGVDEWDYYYAMSDDPNVMIQGEDHELELVQMFKALPEVDKHFIQKILGVFDRVKIKEQG